VRRWYPTSWFERHGEEFVDLLDDTYGVSRLSLRVRLSVMRAGTWERCRVGGLAGESAPVDVRVRAGTLMVLGAWVLFVVAGSGFAKYSEHWDNVTPVASGSLPAMAMTVLKVSAYMGALLCAAAVLASGRCVARLFQRIGTSASLRLIRPGVIAGTIAVLSSGMIVVVAHHLNSTQRNGGLAW